MSRKVAEQTIAGLNRREVVGGLSASAALAAIAPTQAHGATFAADELVYMPASLQLELFRSHKLSPVDVLKAQIARHEAVNGRVNCTTYTYFDKAIKEARESEARWMKGNTRPLEGIIPAFRMID